jgi:7-cyano-7-deazaguanine reductase
MFESQTISLENALKENYLPTLETFVCPYDQAQTTGGVIRIVFPEFTCLCPRTGYPDFGVITLAYLPARQCIELKSWKLYLNAFRMVGTFHETVTHHLFTTICTTLSPRWALVMGDFLPRGNVDTTVVFETDTPRPAGADLLLPSATPRCRQP